MLHLENVPIAVYIIVAGICIAALAAAIVDRRRKNAQEMAHKSRSIRRAARFKTWQWLFGQPKTKRLVHIKRDDADHGA
jgi:hypothetical protein